MGSQGTRDADTLFLATGQFRGVGFRCIGQANQRQQFLCPRCPLRPGNARDFQWQPNVLFDRLGRRGLKCWKIIPIRPRKRCNAPSDSGTMSSPSISPD